MKRTTPITILAGLVLGSALVATSAKPASAAPSQWITGRASVLPGLVEPTVRGDASSAVISGNGRFVAFSTAGRMVPADTDSVADVYVKDLLTEQVERISTTIDGKPATAPSTPTAMTPDGRFVVFWSGASNLVPGDTLGKNDVFRHDRQSGETIRISVNAGGQPANDHSPFFATSKMDISADGRYVVFDSAASNLGPDANSTADVFIRDVTGTTELISRSTSAVTGNNASLSPSISNDGRYVAFSSLASNLVGLDTNSNWDVFLRDRTAQTTERVSLTDGELQISGASNEAAINGSGSHVVFTSTGKGIAAGDDNAVSDIYLRRRATASTHLISKPAHSGPSNGHSTKGAISKASSYIAYQSTATNLVFGLISNGQSQIYRDRGLTSNELISSRTTGPIGNGASVAPSIGDAGGAVAYESTASNLVTGDTGYRDVFTRRLADFGSHTDASTFAPATLTAFAGSAPPAPAAALASRIESGASPERIVVDLAEAPAFAAKRGPLVRLYAAYFKRLPDLGGLDYWLKKMNGGMKLDQVSSQFARSSEFKTTYGNTTNAKFVTLVFNNVLDRNPDPSGLAYWTKKLAGGMNRGTVMTHFSESSEGKRHFRPRVAPTLMMLGLHGKVPKPAQMDAMLTAQANAGQAVEAAATWLIIFNDDPEDPKQ